MRKIIRIFTLCSLLLLLVSCENPINELTYEDYGVIVDKYYETMWVQPITIDDITTFITYPEISKICVEYKGSRMWIESTSLYNEYKDKINEEVKINVIEKQYQDGSVKYKITNIIGIKND